MITLPEKLTATKYPGYFWDTVNHQLYSVKIDGILKPLKRRNLWDIQRFCPFGWNGFADKWVYTVSVKGRPKYLSDKYLLSLEIEDSEFPIKD